MLLEMTPSFRAFSLFLVLSLVASCASTELSIPSTHPGNPGAPVGEVAFASSLQGTLRAESSSAPQEAAPQEHSHDHATTFTCPMHPEIIRDKAGNCPICGMKLVPKKESK
jgi:Heavy metal binding domain